MRKVIIAILSIVIIISSAVIFNKCYLYYKDDKVYSELQEYKPDSAVLSSEQECSENELLKINSDYKFWLTIDNTEVDYPVVQCDNNDYYLSHNFNKEESIYGTLFVDYINNIEIDKNLVIYGHNMRDGSMFNSLKKYKDEQFFLNNDIKIIDKDGVQEIYEVFSVYVIPATELSFKCSFKDEEEYENYIKELSDKSLYYKDIEITNTKEEDNIITLVTCNYEYNDARLITHAK